MPPRLPRLPTCASAPPPVSLALSRSLFLSESLCLSLPLSLSLSLSVSLCVCVSLFLSLSRSLSLCMSVSLSLSLLPRTDQREAERPFGAVLAPGKITGGCKGQGRPAQRWAQGNLSPPCPQVGQPCHPLGTGPLSEGPRAGGNGGTVEVEEKLELLWLGQGVQLPPRPRSRGRLLPAARGPCLGGVSHLSQGHACQSTCAIGATESKKGQPSPQGDTGAGVAAWGPFLLTPVAGPFRREAQ